jgi:hypothetical protein
MSVSCQAPALCNAAAQQSLQRLAAAATSLRFWAPLSLPAFSHQGECSCGGSGSCDSAGIKPNSNLTLGVRLLACHLVVRAACERCFGRLELLRCCIAHVLISIPILHPTPPHHLEHLEQKHPGT